MIFSKKADISYSINNYMQGGEINGGYEEIR